MAIQYKLASSFKAIKPEYVANMDRSTFYCKKAYLNFGGGQYMTYVYKKKILSRYVLFFKFYYTDGKDGNERKIPVLTNRVDVLVVDTNDNFIYEASIKVDAFKDKIHSVNGFLDRVTLSIAIVPVDSAVILIFTAHKIARKKALLQHVVKIYNKKLPVLDLHMKYYVRVPSSSKYYFYDCGPVSFILGSLLDYITSGSIQNLNETILRKHIKDVVIEVATKGSSTYFDVLYCEPTIDMWYVEKEKAVCHNLIDTGNDYITDTVTLLYVDKRIGNIRRWIGGFIKKVENTYVKRVICFENKKSYIGDDCALSPLSINLTQNKFLYDVIKDSTDSYVIEVFSSFDNVVVHRLKGPKIRMREIEEVLSSVLSKIRGLKRIQRFRFLSERFLLLKCDLIQNEGTNKENEIECFILVDLIEHKKKPKPELYVNIYFENEEVIILYGALRSRKNGILVDKIRSRAFHIESIPVLYDGNQNLVILVTYSDGEIVCSHYKIHPEKSVLRLLSTEKYNKAYFSSYGIMNYGFKNIGLNKVIFYSKKSFAVFDINGLAFNVICNVHLFSPHKELFLPAEIKNIRCTNLSEDKIIFYITINLPEYQKYRHGDDVRIFILLHLPFEHHTELADVCCGIIPEHPEWRSITYLLDDKFYLVEHGRVKVNISRNEKNYTMEIFLYPGKIRKNFIPLTIRNVEGEPVKFMKINYDHSIIKIQDTVYGFTRRSSRDDFFLYNFEEFISLKKHAYEDDYKILHDGMYYDLLHSSTVYKYEKQKELYRHLLPEHLIIESYILYNRYLFV